MKKVSLYLEEKQIAALKQESDRTGVPQGKILRWALDKYLSSKKRGSR